MKKNILFFALLVALFFNFKFFYDKRKERTELAESSALIKESVKNVGKLIVTEGHFSEVFTYKNSKEILGKYYTAEKKAMVAVNADVSVRYDLSKMTYEVDEANKVLRIIAVPEPELKISPDFEYYDIQDGFLNPFEAKDYNEVKARVSKKLKTKIENSTLKENAKDRLFTELTKFFVVTKSLGWRLEYKETEIVDINSLKL